MKDTIYTIPLTDAFKADDECPFCFIQRKLEQDAVSFILGCAYMEDDIRATTDEMGFCKEHYKKMYDYGNRLGMALMLHTHYIALEKELKKKLNGYTPGKTSVFSKFKKTKTMDDVEGNPISEWIKEKNDTCYVCDYIDTNFIRYMNTFFYLMETSPEFKTLFKDCKGFCLHHFGELMALSDTKIPDKEKPDFYALLFEKMQSSLKRIEDDLEWFIDKYDYRNKDADWKTSKDAIPRGIQKLVGGYVSDEPFKEK